jgi:hypothetical protein
VLPKILIGVAVRVVEAVVVRQKNRITTKNYKNPEMPIPIKNIKGGRLMKCLTMRKWGFGFGRRGFAVVYKCLGARVKTVADRGVLSADGVI